MVIKNNNDLTYVDLNIIYHALKDFKNLNPEGMINEHIEDTMRKIKLQINDRAEIYTIKK